MLTVKFAHTRYQSSYDSRTNTVSIDLAQTRRLGISWRVVVAHELGHAACRHKNITPQTLPTDILRHEAEACNWAINHWTGNPEEMERNVQTCLQNYLNDYHSNLSPNDLLQQVREKIGVGV